MTYFKEIDVFGNLTSVYEAEEPKDDNDIEIDEDDYMDLSLDLFNSMYDPNDNVIGKGGPEL